MNIKRKQPVHFYLFFVSGLGSGLIESFSKAAFSKKLFFELSQLLIKQIVGLMDQADDSIGSHFFRASLDIGLISPKDIMFHILSFAFQGGFAPCPQLPFLADKKANVKKSAPTKI